MHEALADGRSQVAGDSSRNPIGPRPEPWFEETRDASTGGIVDEAATECRDVRPFLALEAATMISGTGNGVAAIALPWLTLQLTNDPAAAGIVVAAGALPTLAASLASGVIIDRLGRKRTSVASDAFSAVSAAMIPVFGLLGMLTYPLVLAASVIGATFDPVGVTARETMLPDVARQARMPLERVNGVHEAVWGLAWLIGPGVAGVLIATIGAEMSFWAMCVGFVASAVLVGIARLPKPLPRPATEHQWFVEAMEGLRFVWSESAIRSTAVLSTIVFTCTYSVVAVVLPVAYQRMDQPGLLGLLFATFSAGGVVGALAYGAAGTRLPRRPVFVAGLVAAAAVAGIFALWPPYWVQMFAMALAGFLTGPVNPILNVVLQERAAEEMRGRALSMVFALEYALFPVGYVAAGFMINAIGVTWTLAVMAVFSGVVAGWSVVTPALRTMDAPDKGTELAATR
jgi:MFS family permease